MSIQIINPSSCRLGVMPMPLPVVLVSYLDKRNKANITTVSYAGQLATGLIYIGLRPSRNAFEKINQEGRFGINYLYPEQAQIADYCGLVSGRDVDKFEATHLVEEWTLDGTPLVRQSPLSLECILDRVRTYTFCEGDSHRLVVGRVLSVVQRDSNPKFLMHRDFQYYSSDNIPLGEVMELGKTWVPRGRGK